jgi:tetratricopeptide (TPR) repeat protein
MSACGNGYTPDRSYSTPEQKTQEEQQLNTAIEKNKTATTDLEKSESAASIALRNMNLGNYKEAIKYYKQVIESDPSNFAALNNLSVMYEEMGDIDAAIKYIGLLYNLYTDNAEVNSDFIRLLITNKQFIEATKVVEVYKKTEKAKTNEEFIKSLEKEIEAARKKGTN